MSNHPLYQRSLWLDIHHFKNEKSKFNVKKVHKKIISLARRLLLCKNVSKHVFVCTVFDWHWIVRNVLRICFCPWVSRIKFPHENKKTFGSWKLCKISPSGISHRYMLSMNRRLLYCSGIKTMSMIYLAKIKSISTIALFL